MKASVLVITYNQEKTIGRAIESLLRQECEYPWEIILADDGSADHTRIICEEYALKFPDRIRLMPKVPNKGLVGNYFDAFEAAEGEYISDCAGDDEWVDVKRLQKQIEKLDSDKSLSVCYCDVEVCEKNRQPILYSTQKIRNRFFKEKVNGEYLLLATLNHVKSLPYSLSSALYRKSALEKVYKKNIGIVRNEEFGVEDVPVIAALASQGDGAYLPIIGYRYYIEGETVSNNLSHEKEFEFYSRILRMTLKLAVFYEMPLKKLKKHYKSKISHIASQARHAGRKDFGERVRKIAKEWGLPLTLRAKIHLWLLGKKR